MHNTPPPFTQPQSLLFPVVHSPSLVTLEKKSVELTDTFSPLGSPCVATVLAIIVVDDFLFSFYLRSTLADPPLVSVTPLSRRARHCPGHTTRRSRVIGAPKQKKALALVTEVKKNKRRKGSHEGKALLFPNPTTLRLRVVLSSSNKTTASPHSPSDQHPH